MLPIQVRGIRGAITVRENTAESIMSAVKELLSAVVRENQIKLEDIVSVFFTATEDLNAEFPALAAREMGWRHVPLLCAREINVPGAMARVIRVLLHVNMDRSPNELKHLYLREAAGLRPDLGKTD